MISFLPPQAKAIGAVNTIVKDPSTGKLLGDNTDWIGIRDAVRAKLQRVARKQKNGSNRSGGNASPAAKIVSSPLSPANIKMNVTMGPGTSPNRGNGPAYLPSVFGGTAARESTFVPAAGLVVGAGGMSSVCQFIRKINVGAVFFKGVLNAVIFFFQLAEFLNIRLQYKK